MARRPSQTIYHVRPDQNQQTLAAVLRSYMPERSWSQVQQLVQGRHVLVCGNLCLDPARRVKTQDTLAVLNDAAPALPTADDVVIRFADSHLLIVEKPAGITSTRHREEENWSEKRKQFQPTLEDILPEALFRFEGRQSRRNKLAAVWPVHRLDRDTSGLMVFARNDDVCRKLGKQFRHHTVDRQYQAVAPGQVPAMTIDTHLNRDRGDGKRGSTGPTKFTVQAVTHVEPLETLGPYTLIGCRLETGRTHQIRIHLSEAGFPLCGEKVYRQPLGKPYIPDQSGAPRIVLHAAELGVTHPVTGRRLHYTQPFPPDLAQFVSKLRAAAQ